MKRNFKYLIALLFLCFFTLIGCDNKTTSKQEKLSITYYDSGVIVGVYSYTKNNFKLENYSKEYFTFDGWYLDEELSIPFDANNIDEYFKEKRMELFAKMIRNNRENKIEVIGLINDKTLLNPAFTWENNNLDTSFKVRILNSEGLVVESIVNTSSYSTNRYLEKGVTYKLEVIGVESNYTSTKEFTTIQDIEVSSSSITLNNPYSSNMVIQRDIENIIGGKGPKNQVITLAFGDEYYYGISDESGNFEIVVPKKSASFDPINITVTNGVNQTVELKNVLIGDVYLFTGQSNMQWPTGSSDYDFTDIDNAIESNVRFFSQDVVESVDKLEYVKNGKWFVPDSYNVIPYSAIAFMSGSILSTSLKEETPIGILSGYQGNTNIVNWMGSEYYQGTISTKHLHYNAMIYPLRHANIKGVVWYQGCNNSAAGGDYKDLLIKFFENYRDLFNNQNLPFYVIGLACYDGDSGNNFDFSYVRESQKMACDTDDKAYFISSCDDGDPTFIHPSTKRYICERVAKSILGSIYNKGYYTEGPSYKSHTVEGNIVTIELNNSKGLKAKGEIKNLYLAGEDGKYFLATAKIENEKIIASTDKVPNPVYIKYGFGKSPFVNIFNKDGFAITPFRTDKYNVNIDLFDYETNNNYYKHPDGSLMNVSITLNNSLLVTKTNDSKTYGSIRLDKWGMIAYQPQGFRLTVTGNNSGASIAFRAIEGDSNEIWSYKFVDNFEGKKTFEFGIGDFQVVYNKQNSIFDTQKISYIEVMIEANGEATIEINEARFIEIEKTKPMSFNIISANETEDSVQVLLSSALFGEEYKLTISKDGESFSNPIFESTKKELLFTIEKNKFEVGVPYYISAVSINELGETEASNKGLVFYLKDENSVVICNFDFLDQGALDSYTSSSSMDIHSGLSCVLDDNGVKIISSGAGWQQFIFKLDSGFGKGMSKLSFNADFTNYNGTVVMQLADTSWNVYEYKLNTTEKNSGEFIIDFSSFVKGSTPFTTQNLMWVMFNFQDTIGNGYIILDDVKLLK